MASLDSQVGPPFSQEIGRDSEAHVKGAALERLRYVRAYAYTLTLTQVRQEIPDITRQLRAGQLQESTPDQLLAK